MHVRHNLYLNYMCTAAQFPHIVHPCLCWRGTDIYKFVHPRQIPMRDQSVIHHPIAFRRNIAMSRSHIIGS